MTCGVVYHPSFLMHQQSPSHPERRERLAYTLDQLQEEGIFDLPQIKLITPRIALRDEVLLVHSIEYLRFLEQTSVSGGTIDVDTYVPKGLIHDALLASGGAIAGAEAVLNQEVKNCFVLARPPGHHAGRSQGGGFCYLNNVAIMVRYLQRRGLRRIMILDWDAHHGNGTEEIFYDDPTVLFCSVHQYPFYPGSGRVEDIGFGDGKGYNINLPIPAGSSDKVYRYLLEEVILPLADEYMPDAIAISAGQDNHFSDPLTGLALTAQGYAQLMQEMCILADSICFGRIIAVLEGGYGIEGGLPYTNLGLIAAMAGLDISGIREPEIYRSMLLNEFSEDAFSTVIKMVSDLKKKLADHWYFIRRYE
ncbi:histone deacetylase [Methanospirillum purgamenti]|uniref:Histone deacetylase n=1 Tax=Methanospirillum hungatei TaxID=2203 RepID=A0A8F5VNI2_METHU|nr:histone deacetylase [Methanospirillum hungatei]QXO94988.1 histone deacetylase [Methanospirillum hungatei]